MQKRDFIHIATTHTHKGKVAIMIPDKTDLKNIYITRDKEAGFILVRGSIIRKIQPF